MTFRIVISDNERMDATTLKRPPLTPAYWPGWIGIGLLWLLGKTPQWLALALSVPLGWLMTRLMKRRYRVAERNIERCFPDSSLDQREELLKQFFRSLARTVFEIAWSWSASDRMVGRITELRGLEHLHEARKDGKGVLMITAHMTCLEIGARAVGSQVENIQGMYRPLKSPLLEWYQNRGRLHYGSGMIDKRDIRGTIRYLRKGGALWYASDQDFGAEQSLFVPFFGIETASLLATRRLPEMTGCRVLMMFPSYDSKTRRYLSEIHPCLENFPGEDAREDLARINAEIERHVRKFPEQYWWIHRRFKTRPEGEPPFY